MSNARTDFARQFLDKNVRPVLEELAEQAAGKTLIDSCEFGLAGWQLDLVISVTPLREVSLCCTLAFEEADKATITFGAGFDTQTVFDESQTFELPELRDKELYVDWMIEGRELLWKWYKELMRRIDRAIKTLRDDDADLD
jgi:hypothetical protein